MTHREYILIVENPIYEMVDSAAIAFYKNRGETLTLSQADFETIKGGNDIVRYVSAGHGMTATVTFSKENFVNEVTYTEVTVSTGIAKLGKRKSK